MSLPPPAPHAAAGLPLRATTGTRLPRSILMLAPCPFPTGQGTQVVIRHLAAALSHRGHAVHVVSYGHGDRAPEAPFVLHRAARLDRGLRSGPSLRKPAADAALLVQALRVARAHACDVLHAHNVEGLALGALLKLQTGLPLVYHAHNAMGPELPTYFRTHLAQAFAAVVGDVLDRTLPRAADAVITFDDELAALYSAYGVARELLHVIPPGLDGRELAMPPPADVLARLQARLGPGPWVLYAGNPDAYQNLDLLWATLPWLRARMPAARLLVATPHDPALFAAGIAAAHAQEHVTLLQHHSLAELRAAYAIADVGVAPRTLWPGAPIKVLNYLAAGLPVVACASGARHLVPPEAGELVEATPEALADALVRQLARGRQAAARPSTAAFARFELRGHLEAYERVYDEVLARGRRPAAA
jgi:glycosyltransferase involved in cell wall biosynthesis